MTLIILVSQINLFTISDNLFNLRHLRSIFSK